MSLSDRTGMTTPHFASGFSLIELMIAVSIVAVLAAVAYPSYQDQVRKSRRAEAKAALMKTMQAQEKHYTQFNRYLSFDKSTSLDQTPFRAYSGETPKSSSHSIAATACGTGAGEGLDACIKLTAKPGDATGGVASTDEQCGELTLSSTGVKTASGSAGMACWQ